jgi:SPP1 family predicted phage head-tail adaptor
MVMIGELNKRITLQAQIRTSDGMGGFVTGWTDIIPIWAKAWTVSSTEQSGASQLSLIRVQKFKIRYRSVLKSSWRVKYGDRFFNITGIDPDEKNEFIFLTCKEAA